MALLKPRNRKRWLSGEQACELLGIEGTKKTTAASRLAANAERWGIRKIRLGNSARGTVVYPELDLYEYMEHKEREAEARIEPRQRVWKSKDARSVEGRSYRKWLNARAVVYLLGLVAVRPQDGPQEIKVAESRAIQLLNKYAWHWGIRQINHAGISKTLTVYPEEDTRSYLTRKAKEAENIANYLLYRPSEFPLVVGPGLKKWWGDKKYELELQTGQPTRRTDKPSARFITVEVQPDNSVPPLIGYVRAAEVARRFNLPTDKVSESKFWSRFSISLRESWQSSRRYDGNLIELYFEEKREAGEKVYRLTTAPKQTS